MSRRYPEITCRLDDLSILARHTCLCGSGSVSCHGCAEPRCLTCEPYTEHERLRRCCSSSVVIPTDEPLSCLDVHERAAAERRIAGALKSTIDLHGPITADFVSSAAKRIYGTLKGEELRK